MKTTTDLEILIEQLFREPTKLLVGELNRFAKELKDIEKAKRAKVERKSIPWYRRERW